MGKKVANRADELTFAALTKALDEKKLQLYLLSSQINRPGSPVYNPWEVLLPILVPVLLGLMMILVIGPILGLILMIGLILISNQIIKKKVEHKLLSRTQAFMVSSLENFEKVWAFGGVVLVNPENKNVGCVAPEGEWREFVVTHFSALMVEKKEEAPKDEKTK